MIKKSDLKLVPYNNIVLNKPPKEFDFNGDLDPVMLTNLMHDRMKELGGVGLSANQVGLNIKMFVLGSGEVRMTVFNPELIEVSKEEVTLDEGCLSFPGIYLKVNRPASCKVKYRNEKNELVAQELSGLTARIFLHEYDHMMGTTFKSRVSKLKWDMSVNKVVKKTKKVIRKNVKKILNDIKEQA